MKRFTLILIAFIIGLGIYSCSSDDGGNNPDPSKPQASDWTVFKNQTGNPNANALQAQYHNPSGTLNIYGTFDQNNNPYRIHSLTYQKTNNDTLVNMVVDPLYNRIKAVFFTVNGTKQPAVVKFDYTDSNTAGVSYYNYDWSAKTAEMLYSCNVEIPPVQGFAAFAPNKTTLSINWEALGVLGASVAITEGLILATGGETVIIAALGTVAAAPIVGTIATVGITVGVVAAALAVITGDANAAEPADIPYPDGTPAQNPVGEEENPDNNLPVSDCVENALVYNVFIDMEGTIVIETPSGGGTPPYSYFLEGQAGFTDIGIYANDYPNGEYTVAVKDNDGCITIKSVELSRDCAGSDLAVTATATGDSATAAATGGVPPYSYAWSNGTTGATATGLADGEYTVTVTDDNGCNATASVTVGEETVTDIEGNVYKVVTIGDQKWMQSNLKVNFYRNGDAIPYFSDMASWVQTTTGACCNYSFSYSYDNLYGKLYNIYAVQDPRGLAPEGWHIPTYEDWYELFTTLGGLEVAGGKLKSTTDDWISENTDATNESGFTALPSGCQLTSTFAFLGQHACFGFNQDIYNEGTEFATIGILELLNYPINNQTSSTISTRYEYPTAGFSIRCVKDKK